MAKYVQVAAVQFTTEAKQCNRDSLVRETAAVLAGLKGFGLDLVVLSEGIEDFAQTVDQAEELARPGPVLEMYLTGAQRLGAHLAASMKIRENGRAYNSLVFISPTGKVLGVYHKSNLTIGELEEGLVPGAGAVVVDSPLGRLGGAICFDLNFSWLRDEYAKLRPDFLCFSSMFHGGSFTQGFWAHQARAFFVSALPYSNPPIVGGIFDPFGQGLAVSHCYCQIPKARVNLDRALCHLDFNAPQLLELEKKYGREVRLEVPAHLGQAMIYSESDRRSALDLVKEFGIELFDDYYARALARNAVARK